MLKSNISHNEMEVLSAVYITTFSLVTQYLVSCGSVKETMPRMFNLKIYKQKQKHFHCKKLNVTAVK